MLVPFIVTTSLLIVALVVFIILWKKESDKYLNLCNQKFTCSDIFPERKEGESEKKYLKRCIMKFQDVLSDKRFFEFNEETGNVSMTVLKNAKH